MHSPDLGTNLHGLIILLHITPGADLPILLGSVSRKQGSVKTPEMLRNCSKYYSYKFSSFF